MTELGAAKAARDAFEKVWNEGHPWVPGIAFIDCPDLGGFILTALDEHVRACERKVNPAKMVSFTEE